jgi:SAM-dependent methyltransferase
MHPPSDNWASAVAYEAYMGRWSRRAALAFLEWLAPEPGLKWLDIGCGTGALTEAVLRTAAPRLVVGCDPSKAFINSARSAVKSTAVQFEVAGIDRLPAIDPGFDCIVSGLVLNFLPSADAALKAMAEVSRPGGRIAGYVWDYAGRMDLLRIFWEEAVAVDPAAGMLDAGRRFPVGREGALGDAFTHSGLTQVRRGEFTIPTVFAGFDDFWEPFEKGTGSAPSYVAGLDSDRKGRLKARLRKRLAPAGDAPIRLTARAWAASGLIGGEQAP